MAATAGKRTGRPSRPFSSGPTPVKQIYRERAVCAHSRPPATRPFRPLGSLWVPPRHPSGPVDLVLPRPYPPEHLRRFPNLNKNRAILSQRLSLRTGSWPTTGTLGIPFTQPRGPGEERSGTLSDHPPSPDQVLFPEGPPTPSSGRYTSVAPCHPLSRDLEP